jgi:hypothetical protein
MKKNNNYEMIIWWSGEDAAFLVDVPELPGCMAHGKTRAQAIKNAEDVSVCGRTSQWFAGCGHPPRST